MAILKGHKMAPGWTPDVLSQLLHTSVLTCNWSIDLSCIVFMLDPAYSLASQKFIHTLNREHNQLAVSLVAVFIYLGLFLTLVGLCDITEQIH